MPATAESIQAQGEPSLSLGAVRAFLGGAPASGPRRSPAAAACLSSVTNRRAPVVQNAISSVLWAKNGSFAKLTIPSPTGGTGGGQRQAISEFTPRAQRRLLAAINSVDRSRAPADQWWFPCLTYPVSFPTPRESKRHFKIFRDRFRRTWPQISGVWKLEPQKRGAPHYHCLLRIPPGTNPQEVHYWWCHTWHEIAGGGDVKHLTWHMHSKAFEAMRTWDGVGSYAAKYCGKIIKAGEGWDQPGRLWGKLNWESMPIDMQQQDLEVPQARKLKRGMLAHLDHQKTGRYHLRNNDTGKVQRAWIRPKNVTAFQDAGFTVRPYHRRRRRRSLGGCEMLIPSHVLEQLLAWATGPPRRSRFAEWIEWIESTATQHSRGFPAVLGRNDPASDNSTANGA